MHIASEALSAASDFHRLRDAATARFEGTPEIGALYYNVARLAAAEDTRSCPTIDEPQLVTFLERAPGGITPQRQQAPIWPAQTERFTQPGRPCLGIGA